MPDLPTLTLTQEHFDRVVAAFPGANATEKADNYKAWLVNKLLDQVEMVEMRRARAAILSSLPTRPTFPDIM